MSCHVFITSHMTLREESVFSSSKSQQQWAGGRVGKGSHSYTPLRPLGCHCPCHSIIGLCPSWISQHFPKRSSGGEGITRWSSKTSKGKSWTAWSLAPFLSSLGFLGSGEDDEKEKINRTRRNQFLAFTEKKIQEHGESRAKSVCPLGLTCLKKRAVSLVADLYQRGWHFTPDLLSPLEM